MGEFVAMGVAACLLLEYGVSISAVAVGWSGYLNKLLDNLFGWQIPQSLTSAPWDATPGIVNLPAVLLIVMCMALLIRRASESALVNTIMVLIKLGVPAMFIVIALTAFNADHFHGFWDKGMAGINTAALDDADWQDGDLLAIGTSPVGGIARVFLGSRGSKILRHSPVPVLVLPG
jgi:amino acid transporter